MKNKGFTLVELLATIIILGILAAIIFPSVKDILNRQKQKLYDQQIVEIEKAAKGWGAKNSALLPNRDHPETIYIKLQTLVDSELLSNKDILDSRDDSPMNGCIGITYDLEYNQYEYSFVNVNDNTYNNECDGAI